MKKIIYTLFLSLIFISAFSQEKENISYDDIYM